MKKIEDFSLKTITAIQVMIATIISLLFQFVFPMNWQPLDVALYGPNIKHGDPDINIVISTVSQWYFSFSIAWLIYRDNPYINNFLIYSLGSLVLILFAEIFILHVFWDYIHIPPLIVAVYLLSKKRKSLHQEWFPHYFTFTSIWLFLAYIFQLSYLGEPFFETMIKWAILSLIAFAISFTFPDNIYVKYQNKNREVSSVPQTKL